MKHNSFQQSTRGNKKNATECRNDEAVVAGHFMLELKRKYKFGQQFTLDKGPKKFGDAGVKGTEKEIGQLHDGGCFGPVRVAEMT